MSQSHIKKPKEPPPQSIRWKLALVFTALVLSVAAVFVIANWAHSFPSTYSTTSGKVLEIRKVVDGTVDSLYGGRVRYGFEARVQYMTNGQMQERWLRASDDMPRETLLLKLVSHPTECVVCWPTNHPENTKCWPK
jgi:hypothetical protein